MHPFFVTKGLVLRYINMKLKFTTPIFIISSFIVFSSFYFIKLNPNPRSEQTVPEDMLFIEGNDSLMSYYIGKTEETNYNWQVYIAWLKNVYIDYPAVAEAAVPLDTVEGLWQYYNDPVLNHYSTHPAYQSYPVTGVTWLQIQDYLSWKTDRLNEMILIKNRILNFNPDQFNEDNFNTEAYFEGQYEGAINEKGQLRNLNPHEDSTRRVKPSDGILLPQFRLPTEAEWDYANQLSNAGVSRDSYHLTGKNYFLDPWASLYNILGNNNMKIKGTPYPSATGFEGGVMEWLIDLKDSVSHAKENNYEIYLRNGYKVFNFYGDVLDYDGYIREKDSVGKLPLLYTGLNNVGIPNYVTSYKIYHRACTTFLCLNPFYKNGLLLNEYCRTSNLYYDSISRANVNYLNNNGPYKNNCYKFIPDDTVVYFTGIYDGAYVNFSSKDSIFIKGMNCVNIQNEIQIRKIKIGNFKNPSSKTDSKLEDQSNPFLGFRCVLPSTGVECKDKYKVKW